MSLHFKITCPKCGKEGIASHYEQEAPFDIYVEECVVVIQCTECSFEESYKI